MNIIGIIAEYNPFHTGHAFHITQSRAKFSDGESAVVIVMSGNWVQQAHCAIADKWTRAALALAGGADLVLELPTVWATASAERFARGAAELLDATGLVTHLSFGSESGTLKPLQAAAKQLDRPEYPEQLRHFLAQGSSFPVARQQAVAALTGTDAQALSTANNNLGIEYLRSLWALNSSIQPMTVRREGAGHNTMTEDAPLPHVSATQIRRWLTEGKRDCAQPYLLPQTLEQLSSTFPDLAQAERAILLRVRTMTAADWSRLPDSGTTEGLPLRLERAGQQARSLDEFYQLACTKRYTNARLRRLVLWSYLGLTKRDFSAHPAYLRVLGSNTTGRQLLRQMKDTASLPILTKPAHARKLDLEGQQQFDLEVRCTDLYDLCFPTIPTPGREWRTNPILMD